MEVKPGYKQTEVGIIPEEWEVKPLGDIGGVRMCKRVLKHQTRDHGDVPFYKIGTFGGVPDAFISHSLFDEFKRKYSFPQKGDVLISAAGTIGRTVIYDGVPAYFQDSNIVWIENDETKASNAYLWHRYQVTKWAVSHGGTVARLYNDSLRTKIHIPVPPLPEQRAIAAALSDVDGLLGGLDRLIAKKRDLKQAAMQQLLTGQTRLPGFHGEWEVKRLDAIADVIDPHPSHRAPDEVSNGVPFVGIGDLDEDGNLVGSKLRYVDRAVLVEHAARYNLDDQLIGLGRVASIGKVVCLKPLPEGFAISPTLGVIRGRIVQRGYLLYALRSKFITEQFTRIMSGSTRSSVGMEVLRKLDVLLPPKPEEQTAIATVLSEMDGELAVLEQRREKTRALKQAMMQELLTGRTRLV